MITSGKKRPFHWAAGAALALLLALLLAGCASLPASTSPSAHASRSSAPPSSASEPGESVSEGSSDPSSDPSVGIGTEFIQMVSDRGYKRLMNSGIYGYPVLLPESFTAEKDGFAVGEFLNARNELSKQNDLDFSSHLGERVYFCTCGGEKRAAGDTEETEEAGGPGSVDLIALYGTDRTLIAFWEAPKSRDKDQSDCAVFTQILSDEDS